MQESGVLHKTNKINLKGGGCQQALFKFSHIGKRNFKLEVFSSKKDLACNSIVSFSTWTCSIAAGPQRAKDSLILSQILKFGDCPYMRQHSYITSVLIMVLLYIYVFSPDEFLKEILSSNYFCLHIYMLYAFCQHLYYIFHLYSLVLVQYEKSPMLTNRDRDVITNF